MSRKLKIFGLWVRLSFWAINNIKIINLKAVLNKRLSEKLRINFPGIINTEKLKVNTPINIDYNWITGFYSGEGSFLVDIFKSKIKVGYSVVLQIAITQHFIDVLLINNIKCFKLWFYN